LIQTINGITKRRKRHLITNTNGLLLSVEIHATSEHDSKAGFRVIEALNYRFGSMKKVYADGVYRGELAEKEKNKF
jgi:putative transposase